MIKLTCNKAFIGVFMVTEKSFWMGRDKTYAGELTTEIKKNADELLKRVNGLLVAIGRSPIVEQVSSGWRPSSVNAATPGAAKKSSHMIGKAVDIVDRDGKIKALIVAHPELLKKFKLNMEDPASTSVWAHFDSRDELGYKIFKI
jgi:hypothetical protein